MEWNSEPQPCRPAWIAVTTARLQVAVQFLKEASGDLETAAHNYFELIGGC